MCSEFGLGTGLLSDEAAAALPLRVLFRKTFCNCICTFVEGIHGLLVSTWQGSYCAQKLFFFLSAGVQETIQTFH